MGLFSADSDVKSADGLFPSGAAKKKKSGFNWGDAALAAFGVPVQQIQDRRLKRTLMQQKQTEFEQAQQQQAQLEAAIDSDPMLNTPQLKAYAKANPQAYISNVMQRFQPRQFAAGGGSLGTPNASGQLDFQTAPRFDDNGTIYGAGDGTKSPPILQRGNKVVPVAPGGYASVIDSVSGEPRMGGSSNLDAIPTVEEGHAYRPGPGGRANQANWTPLANGGAGPQTPPTFSGPAF